MIDFKKYNNPEIVNNIAAVMSAPQRAPIRIVKFCLIFTFFGLVISGTRMSLSGQSDCATIFSSISVAILLAMTGVLLGAFSFLRDLNNSFQNILKYAKKVVHFAVQDISDSFETFGLGVSGNQVKLPGVNEIVSDILLEVVNPAARSSLLKIPLLGKFAAKAYSIAVKGLLKISSAFFSKVDKKIDKVVNERLNKAKGAVDVPLNFAESTVKETWMPRITENADKFMDKSRTYIRRVYFGMSLPILLMAIALVSVSMVIVV